MVNGGWATEVREAEMTKASVRCAQYFVALFSRTEAWLWAAWPPVTPGRGLSLHSGRSLSLQVTPGHRSLQALDDVHSAGPRSC